MAISKIVRHASNPFMPLLLKQSKKGQSFTKYSTEDSSKFMILDTDTLSAKPVSVFGSSQEVEINNFVKLYADGVGGIMGLSNPGKKVFAVLYLQIRSKEGQDKDEIILSYDLIPQEVKDNLKLSRTTFYRGVKDLVKLNFIAYTMASNVYYINPTFLFNGNRLVVMKQYELKIEAETRENFDRLNKKIKKATTVNIPAEKTESEQDLFKDQKNQMKTQLADGRKYDTETGEILTDNNGTEFQQINMFPEGKNQ